MRSYHIILIAIAGIFLAGCGGGPSSMYRENNQRTGFSEEPAISTPPSSKIVDDFLGLGEKLASPVFVGKYFIDSYWGITKIRISNSEWIWNKRVPEKVVSSTPTVVQNHIYIPSGHGFLSAYRLKDGETVWSQRAANAAIMTSPCVVNGKVIVTTTEATVAAFQREDGTEIWKVHLSAPSYSSPTYADGILYLGCLSGVYAFRESDGTQLWYTQDIPVTSTVALSDSTLFLGTGEGKLVALEASDGSILWQYDTGGEIAASPAVDEDAVFIGTVDGSFVSVDKETGTQLWAADGVGVIRSSPLVAGDAVYFGSLDGNLYAFNKTNGELLWKFDAKGPIRTSPTIFKDHLYILTDKGILYALE